MRAFDAIVRLQVLKGTVLGVDDAVYWLVQKGLADAADVVDGRIRVVDVSRRNRNLRVQRNGRASYFLKQPDDPRSIFFAREAHLYRAFRDCGDLGRLAGLAPALIREFDDPPCMVLSLLEGARTMRESLSASPQSAQKIGARVGASVAALRCGAPATHPGLCDVPRWTPWIFSVASPGRATLSRMTANHASLLRLIQQQPELTRRLAELQNLWQVHSLVHADLKGDNLLVAGEQVYIVDWEFALLGDSAWDLASVLTDVAAWWVLSLPFAPDHPLEEVIAKAPIQIDVVRAFGAAAWHSNLNVAPVDDVADFAHRCVLYAGARLVQTAYEHGGDISLPGIAVPAMLQMADNLFENPASAAAEIFGIPPFFSHVSRP
jgi:hypothetical protein